MRLLWRMVLGQPRPVDRMSDEARALTAIVWAVLYLWIGL